MLLNCVKRNIVLSYDPYHRSQYKALNQIVATMVMVSPNPGTTLLRVSHAGTLTVHGASGRCLTEGRAIAAGTSIDISPWPVGLYRVTLTDLDGYTHHQKWMRR